MINKIIFLPITNVFHVQYILILNPIEQVNFMIIFWSVRFRNINYLYYNFKSTKRFAFGHFLMTSFLTGANRCIMRYYLICLFLTKISKVLILFLYFRLVKSHSDRRKSDFLYSSVVGYLLLWHL